MRSHGSPVNFPVNGKGETLLPILNRVEMKTQRTTRQSVSPLSAKFKEQFLLEIMLRCVKNMEVTDDGQHGFTED